MNIILQAIKDAFFIRSLHKEFPDAKVVNVSAKVHHIDFDKVEHF